MNFQMLIYLLPPILIFTVVHLVLSLVRKNKRSIYICMSTILVILLTLTIYYFPNDDILDNNKFESISLSVKGMAEVEVHDKNSIDKIVAVMDNHTYIRSAVETIERRRFESRSVIELNMVDLRSGTFFHLYIFENPPQQSFLQINSQRYKIRNSKKLTNELMDILNGLV